MKYLSVAVAFALCVFCRAQVPAALTEAKCKALDPQPATKPWSDRAAAVTIQCRKFCWRSATKGLNYSDASQACNEFPGGRLTDLSNPEALTTFTKLMDSYGAGNGWGYWVNGCQTGTNCPMYYQSSKGVNPKLCTSTPSYYCEYPIHV